MSKLLANKFFLLCLGIVAVLGLLLVTFNASQNSGTPNPTASPTQQPFVNPKSATMPPPVKDTPISGQIIVKFKPQYTNAEINAYLKQYGASIKKTIGGINETVIYVPNGQENTIMQELLRGPYVESTQRDYTTHAFLTPNDPLFNVQYAFNNSGQSIQGQTGTAGDDINVEQAWDVTEGAGVKVAILDTGIDLNQPDLQGKVVLQDSFIGNASVQDGNGHGTHVAGILSANTNNNLGVAGTCPDCELMIGQVLDAQGEGSTSDAVNGMTWAANNGAKVISMSLGTTEASSEPMYAAAVAYAMSKGAIVVAAAGNDSESTNTDPSYPGDVPGVVSVAATTNTNALASFSNYGPGVEIAAPGLNILSTGPTAAFTLEPFGYSFTQPYYYLSGTSMATPMVAGVAALVASTQFGTTPQALIARLYSTAVKIPGTGTDFVNGLVDAAAAVGPAPTATTAPQPTDITPTLFCEGGNGTPPCATIPPTTTTAPGTTTTTAPTVADVSPATNTGTTPTPTSTLTGTPLSTVLPCTNNSVSSLSDNGGNSTVSAQAAKHKKGHKTHKKNNGEISKLIQFLLQLLEQLLQLIGQCSTVTPTPTPTPVPTATVAPTETPVVPTVTTSPTVVVTPTVSPTVSPVPTATPTIIPVSVTLSPAVLVTPTVVISVAPTATTAPSTAVTPTVSPVPTATTAPTATPTPTGTGNNGAIAQILQEILQFIQLIFSLLAKIL
jgi:thermitase